MAESDWSPYTVTFTTGKTVIVQADPYPAAAVMHSRPRAGSGSCPAVDPCYPAVKGALGTKQWPTSLPTRSLRYTSFISRGRRPPG